MLYGALPTIPITELRTQQPAVLESLQESPIILTRDGRGAGVLVHPQTWNFLIDAYEKAWAAGLLDSKQSALVVAGEQQATGKDEFQQDVKRLHRLELLAEVKRLKAKGEPSVSLAEVKRRIAAKGQ